MRHVQPLKHNDLAFIAASQRFLIVGVVISWGYFVFAFPGAEPFDFSRLALAQISIAIPYHFLATYLRQGFADRWLLPLMCLFPVFGIVIAQMLNQQATDALRLKGYRVGLFGLRQPTGS
ncbi:MAG: hypothetical protein EA402_12400 [Planctomycetota bacterium]|nr:MAG: hypothetical protein EA402_12400 [Planctomycetota bacterium]